VEGLLHWPLLNHLKTSTKPKEKEERKCLCNEGHLLPRCPKFLEKLLPDRKVIVFQKRFCLNCLGPHQEKDCHSKFSCGQCQGKHHTLLHYPENEQTNGVKPPQCKTAPLNSGNFSALPSTSSASTPLNVNAHMFFNGSTSQNNRQSSILLGIARVIVEDPKGRIVEARALIDNCSQPSFISQRLRNQLGLVCSSMNASFSAIGGVQAVTSQILTEFKLRPHFNSRFFCNVEALVVPRVCSYVPPQKHLVSDLLYLSHLNLADPQFLDNTEIDILLGAEIHAKIVQENIVRGQPGEPIATATMLGWLISGPVPLLNSFVSNSVSLHCTMENSLSFDLQKFWCQEELPAQSKCRHPDDEKSERHYLENVKRDNDGRYIVKLPFKSTEKSNWEIHTVERSSCCKRWRVVLKRNLISKGYISSS